MHRSAPPPLRVLVVAATVADFPAGDDLWRHVPDAAVAEATGYSLRTVKLAWQEIADLGMAAVTRSDGSGVRMVRPSPHELWQAAFALAKGAQS